MVFGWIVDRDSSHGRRRRAVVAHFLAILVALVAWHLGTSSPEGLFWPSMVAFLVFAAVGSLICVAVKNSTQRIAEGWGDDGLDERQREVRDRSYRAAYRVLAVSSVAIVAYVQFALLAGLPLPGREHAYILFPLCIWLAAVLPTTILAWTEPEPEGARLGAWGGEA